MSGVYQWRDSSVEKIICRKKCSLELFDRPEIHQVFRQYCWQDSC